MRTVQSQPADDIAIVDCETRILVSIAARYTLTDWCDSQRYRPKFACRMISVSSREATMLAPVTGGVGDRITVYCDEFGKLEGSIWRLLEHGFVVRIAATESERRKLAARVEGYEKVKNYDIIDRREHKRIIPIDPSSTIFFADGSRMDCFVIDISTSRHPALRSLPTFNPRSARRSPSDRWSAELCATSTTALPFNSFGPRMSTA